MRVAELYGPVPQGEGLLLGVSMPFLRVAGCNLSCSWCDSAYTWEPGYAYTEMSAKDVTHELVTLLGFDTLVAGGGWVSITGGEPTIYAPEVLEIVLALKKRGVRVVIETNGLRVIEAFDQTNVVVSCSPKLPGSGQDTPARRARVQRLVAARNALKQRRERTQYKFVIATPADLDVLPAYCESVGIDLSGAPGTSPVYLQPDGYIEPVTEYLRALRRLQNVAPTIAPGLRVSPQVHRLVHGADARGV